MDREQLLESIKIISEQANDNEEVMQKLKGIHDYVLLKENEIEELKNKNETNEYKQEEIYDNDGISWKQKYSDMKDKYRNRFFSNDTPEKAFLNEVERRQEDTDTFVRERNDIRIDDLFRKEDR